MKVHIYTQLMKSQNKIKRKEKGQHRISTNDIINHLNNQEVLTMNQLHHHIQKPFIKFF